MPFSRRLAPFAVATALLAPHALSAQTPPAGAPPVPVITAAAERGQVPVEVPATGTVAAESTVSVRSRVDGQIQQVHVREGQFVRRGNVLFTLDARLTQAVLQQQEAQLARDRALAQSAQAQAQRQSALRGQGFAAQQAYEQAQADAAAAAATVRADEALIAQTRLSLDYATITAEADGRLGALPQQVGNYIRSAEATVLATITQMDPIDVQFSVPERWLPEILAAQREAPPRVAVRPADSTAPPVEGELVFIDSQVDSTTGTIALKARFANPELRLWPGQYVSVSLVPRVEADALTVPVQAVQAGQQGRYVFVLDGEGRARRRPVELLRVAAGRAVLRADIAAGDKVVVEGAQLLTDGARTVERGAPRP